MSLRYLFCDTLPPAFQNPFSEYSNNQDEDPLKTAAANSFIAIDLTGVGNFDPILYRKVASIVGSRHPTLKWAQRDDLLFITIDLQDAKGVKLNLEPDGKFYFSATAGADNIPYEVDINLFDKVDVNESKASVGSRSIVYLIKKEESKWWSRLLKQEGRTPVFIKVDWNKWVDEDEQDEQAVPDMEYDDVNFSSLNLGGGGGQDVDGDYDEDESDSDTEDLEETVPTETVGNETGVSDSPVDMKI